MRRACQITTGHPVYDHRILYKECVSLSAASYDVILIAPQEEDVVVEGIPVVGLRGPGRGPLPRMGRSAEAPLTAPRWR